MVGAPASAAAPTAADLRILRRDGCWFDDDDEDDDMVSLPWLGEAADSTGSMRRGKDCVVAGGKIVT